MSETYKDAKIVRTACPYHCSGNSCGVLAHVQGDNITKLEPAEFPDNRFRRVCLRGLSSLQLLNHPDRLKYPLKRVGNRGEGKWARVTWDEALDTIADNFKKIQEKHGPQAIAWVLGGPGGGTTKFGIYCRFAALTHGTRVSCWGYGDAAGPDAMLATFGTHFQGHDTRDSRNSKICILWGTNPAVTRPFQMRHFMRARESTGVKLVAIDPIFSHSAARCDQYIQIRPGTDSALALGMMQVIINNNLHDKDYLTKNTVGPLLVNTVTGQFLREKDLVSEGSDKYMVWDRVNAQPAPQDKPEVAPVLDHSCTLKGARYETAFHMLSELAAQYTPEKTSEITDIPSDVIRDLAIEYASNRPSSIYTNMGVQRTYHGDLSFRTILALAAVCGYYGVKGGGASLGAGPKTYVLNWGYFLKPEEWATYSRLPILNLYEALETGKPFPVKGVWFAFINFVNQSPNSNKIIKDVLPKADFIVDTDLFMNTTGQYSDMVLPVCTFLEHSDLVGGPFPYLQLQQRVVKPRYESKSDVNIINALAEKMGLKEYFHKSEEELVETFIDSKHPSLEGISMDNLKQGPYASKKFAEPFVAWTDQKFPTRTGRIEFYAEKLAPLGEALPVYKPPKEGRENPLVKKYPLVFVQRHSNFRTHSMYANVSWLLELNPEPLVEMNPVDARTRGINEGDMVLVYNDRGKAKLKARLNEGVKAGVVDIAQGWWFHQFGEGGFNCLTYEDRNPAQELVYEANSGFNDVLVEVEKVG
ncbi:MAG: molybdopterin-dependent oxidoreductase [Candidatus Tectomicrobia bacterium]|uniref:Molybdopterin-dependent oxidoreductase n=1 Tax=Tectimicrobiota bacterium TaxID=2528274 RepID=A0A933LPS6_UNCTE|nr:molybdopterin-dependent oxidoreductase [Candidatus Tectomicrobia bacterium]